MLVLRLNLLEIRKQYVLITSRNLSVANCFKISTEPTFPFASKYGKVFLRLMHDRERKGKKLDIKMSQTAQYCYYWRNFPMLVTPIVEPVLLTFYAED